MPSLAAQTPAELPSYAAAREPIAREIRSHQPFEPSGRQVFTLTQRHFVAGGVHLVLETPPEIAVYPGILEFELVGWNIRLPYGKQGEIGRELIRKFLGLHAKLERSALSEQEEAEWREIAKQVDYRRFSIDRSPPRYVTGILVERDEHTCRIEWHDGTRELIKDKPALAFRLLEPGEEFTGLAKFGLGNTLLEITNLSPALRFDDGEAGERMWREWPANQ